MSISFGKTFKELEAIELYSAMMQVVVGVQSLVRIGRNVVCKTISHTSKFAGVYNIKNILTVS